MQTTNNIKKILAQVEKLELKEKINLFEELAIILKKKDYKNGSQFSLSALSGLGNDIWKDIDIDKYLDTERKW